MAYCGRVLCGLSIVTKILLFIFNKSFSIMCKFIHVKKFKFKIKNCIETSTFNIKYKTFK